MYQRQLILTIQCFCDGTGLRKNRPYAVIGKIGAISAINTDQRRLPPSGHKKSATPASDAMYTNPNLSNQSHCIIVIFLMDIDFILIGQIGIHTKTSSSCSATTKYSCILTIGYLNCVFNTICRQNITDIALTLHIKCNQQLSPSENRNHFYFLQILVYRSALHIGGSGQKPSYLNLPS